MQCLLVKDLAKRDEPAWALVLGSGRANTSCAAKNGRDLAICRECPGVSIIQRLAEVVTA